jgi:23S rRNA (guanosine2251-2'-O)-methyltransferase
MSQLEKIYGVHAVEALLRHHPKRVKQVWLAEGQHCIGHSGHAPSSM